MKFPYRIYTDRKTNCKLSHSDSTI